jgi:hypothetical protein
MMNMLPYVEQKHPLQNMDSFLSILVVADLVYMLVLISDN